MHKKEVIKSAFFLVLYSFIAKILSLFVRIVIARTISEEAMTLYSIASPTMVIMITLTQMGIPSTLSKIISDTKYEKKKPVSASIFLSILNNLMFSWFFILLVPILSITILRQGNIAEVLYAIVPLLPVVSMTGILKGYFIGHQQHNPPSYAQIAEEIVRALFIFIAFYYFDISSPVRMASLTMLSIAVGELGSLLVLLGCLPNLKNKMKTLRSYVSKVDKQAMDSVLAISLPITGSRLVGSLTYFLEPFIVVLRMTQTAAIMVSYGHLNGYILPIITMPSFLTFTLSGWLLPSFTYQYSSGNKKGAKRTFLIILFLCLAVGAIFSCLSYFFPEWILMFLYKKVVGVKTLQWLAWPFLIYTTQPVLSSVLHAVNLSKQSFMDTLLGSLLRLATLFLALPILQGEAFALSLTLGMLCTTLLHAIRVFAVLFLHQE